MKTSSIVACILLGTVSASVVAATVVKPEPYRKPEPEKCGE